MKADGLQQRAFISRTELRSWLDEHHASHPGLLVKIYKKHSDHVTITFEDLLKEGLCFGWSESQRFRGTDDYYLQKFTPRKVKGTMSTRNKKLVAKLEREGLMTNAGRAKL